MQLKTGKRSRTQVPGTTNDTNNSQLVSSKMPKVTKKAPQEQHIVPITTNNMQTDVVNTLVNPELKMLFDIESNKEMQVTIQEPDLMLLNSEMLLIKLMEKITV